MSNLLVVTLFWLAVANPLAAPEKTAPDATIQVSWGPTPIPLGAADKPGDLTVINGRFAVSFGVETQAPWGIPSGSILDASLLTNGQIQPDAISFLDFLPNAWHPWPSRESVITVERPDDKTAVVKVERDYQGSPVTTRFTIRAGDPVIEVHTRLQNLSDQPLEALEAGYSLCTKEASVFVPLNPDMGKRKVPELDWVAAYGPDWSVGLSFPEANLTYGSSSWRDLYRKVTIAPGQSVEFAGWYLLTEGGGTGAMLAQRARRLGQSLGSVEGRVTRSDGLPVERPVVVVSQEGRPLGWAVGVGGAYQIDLPPGRYQFQALAVNHSPTQHYWAVVEADRTVSLDLSGLAPPATIDLAVTAGDPSSPVDARIQILGQKPLVHWLAQPVAFTDPQATGTARLQLPPGRSTLQITAGGGVLTEESLLEVDLESGQSARVEVHLAEMERPSQRGWYCADLHHHSNLADGTTTPALLVHSQRTAGLDLVLVSDHDLVINHAEIADLAQRIGMPFLPSVEISPSWGHFNLLVLPVGYDPGLTSARCTPAELFAAASKAQALLQANHPFEDHNAYLSSRDANSVPGGFLPGYHFLEINGDNLFDDDDRKAVREAWNGWNVGSAVLLSGGSDTHSVLSGEVDEVSGVVRTCAYLREELSADGFVDALASGYSYVTFGPLMYPKLPFGQPLPAPTDGIIALEVELFAAPGLSRVEAVCNGKVHSVVTPPPGTQRMSVDLRLPGDATWCALVAWDNRERPAFSNPWRRMQP